MRRRPIFRAHRMTTICRSNMADLVLKSKGKADSMFNSLDRLNAYFAAKYKNKGVALIFKQRVLHVVVDGKLKESHNKNSLLDLHK